MRFHTHVATFPVLVYDLSYTPLFLTLYSLMCGLTTRVVNYNCDKVGAFVRERGREILKALDII